MTQVIEATLLEKEYRSGVKALDGLNIAVASGEIFGLLGPNGAGKTTFVKCLLGLIEPTGGQILLNGKRPSHENARREVGFSPEIPHFPSFLTAIEVMRFHSKLIPADPNSRDEQLGALLEEAELRDVKQKVGSFSKGMLRRLAMAQALIGEPTLLVLDEPTADLDPIGRRDVRNKLEALKSKGTTILLNSHLLSEVERLCDRVAVIHKGKLLAMGSVDELVPEGKDLESVFIDLIERAG
ncbi:MAG: ABC transporter ATP-binding protein [Actinobacteria bacterium]|nr:ABC transporter ATP-binding protein [Actinomycetota bacterium]